MFRLLTGFALFGAMLVGVASLGQPTSATAAANNGANVIRDDYCYDYGWETVCWTTVGVVNETASKSGNMSFSANVREHLRVTENASGNVLFEGDRSEHYHWLAKQGEVHVISDHYRWENSDGWCYSYDFHLANGQVQFDNWESGPCK